VEYSLLMRTLLPIHAESICFLGDVTSTVSDGIQGDHRVSLKDAAFVRVYNCHIISQKRDSSRDTDEGLRVCSDRALVTGKIL
jgi:hypothetical protein